MSGLNENRPITQQVVNMNYVDLGSTDVHNGAPLYSVLAEDGFIYQVVESGTMAQLRQLDPDTMENTLYCNLGIYTGGCGIVQAANSKLYVIPERTTQIMEIDLVNKTVFHFGAFPAGKTRMYYSAHLAPNGNFYMIPYTSAQVVEVNPFTKTCTFIGEPVRDYYRCTMGKDGIIYSFKKDTVLRVNPNDNTVTEEPLAILPDYLYYDNLHSPSCCVTTSGEIVILWANYNNQTETGVFTLSHYNTTTKSHTHGTTCGKTYICNTAEYRYWDHSNNYHYVYPSNTRLSHALGISLKLLNNNNILISAGGCTSTSSSERPARASFVVYDIASRTFIWRSTPDLIKNTRYGVTQIVDSYLINNNTVLSLVTASLYPETRAFKLDTGFAKVIPKTAYMSPYINKMR